MTTRTARINALRGICREFGIDTTQGARLGLEQIARTLANPNTSLAAPLHQTMHAIIGEIRLLELRINAPERAAHSDRKRIDVMRSATIRSERGAAQCHNYRRRHRWRYLSFQRR